MKKFVQIAMILTSSVRGLQYNVRQLGVVGAETSARPSKDDVERISFGKASKKKGVGSRGTPHRLNNDERRSFESAKRKGFVELLGSGWRKERRDAPLGNTWRNWCDAVGGPAIFLCKGQPDTVLLDLSPLRSPDQFVEIADSLRSLPLISAQPDILFSSLNGEEEVDHDDWLRRPIHQLPRYELLWTLDASTRAEAKALSKTLAIELLQFPIIKTARPSSSSLPRAPNVKPGKSRRHGGYGIG